jgi:membrane protein implicated in regulation of membrane protease activity
MGSVTLWNLLFVVELLVAAALVVVIVWAYRRFTRRYREQREQLNTDRS